MTASVIIEQIKALPPGERAKVVGFIHELEAGRADHAPQADDRAFADAARWTFREHADLMGRPAQ